MKIRIPLLVSVVMVINFVSCTSSHQMETENSAEPLVATSPERTTDLVTTESNKLDQSLQTAVTPAPTALPTSESEYALLADFQMCLNANDLGEVRDGAGSANFECIPQAGVGNLVGEIRYNVPDDWAGLRINIREIDLAGYDTLTFWARSDASVDNKEIIRVEIKASGSQEVAYEIGGLTDQWHHFVLPLARFRNPQGFDPICDWNVSEEMLFVLDNNRLEERTGTIYIDEVVLENRSGGGPGFDPDCKLTPQASVLQLAGFNSCESINDLGEAMGVALEPPNQLDAASIEETGRGCVIQLEYDITAWSAYWMKFPSGTDFTAYNQLVFDIKTDNSVSPEMKLELKRAGSNGTEVSIVYVGEISNEWQTKSIPLTDFRISGSDAQLSALTAIEELVFTFELDRAGGSGVIYLDNIHFAP